MNKLSQNIIAFTISVLGSAGICHAEDERFDFGFDATVGGQYDSNVALVDLDSNAGEPDLSTLLEAGISLQTALTDNTSLKLGYDYSGTSYKTYSEFDLALHHGHASVTTRRDTFDAGISLDRYEGVLSGDDYLSLTQLSPNVSRLFGERWYVRGAFLLTDKSYATVEARDATARAARADVYYLMEGLRHYVALGTQFTSEDATDSAYDFAGTQAIVTYGREVQWLAADIDLKAQFRFENRDYEGANTIGEETRRDRRMRLRLSMAFPFSDHVSLDTWLEQTHNQSTLEEANLDRTIVGTQLSVSF